MVVAPSGSSICGQVVVGVDRQGRERPAGSMIVLIWSRCVIRQRGGQPDGSVIVASAPAAAPLVT